MSLVTRSTKIVESSIHGNQETNLMRLTRYVLRRLLFFLPVLLGVTFITFWITRVVPGNPVNLMVHFLTDQAVLDQLTREYGFDQPFYIQYWRYLTDLIHGDMGISFSTGHPVTYEITQRFPATFELTTLSMLLAVIIGVPMGMWGAFRRGSFFDHVSRIFSVIGVSLPVFWFGIILILVFYYQLRWVPPPMGRLPLGLEGPPTVTGLYTLDSIITGNWEVLIGSLRMLALPVISLGLPAVAPVARMMRSEMIEVLESDYIRTAQALGLSWPTILVRHAFKNSVLPVITIVGVIYGFTLGGSILVETIFSWPGMGLYAYNAAMSSDYPAVQGFMLYASLVYLIVFLVVDILYFVFDPRIEY